MIFVREMFLINGMLITSSKYASDTSGDIYEILKMRYYHGPYYLVRRSWSHGNREAACGTERLVSPKLTEG